MPRLHKEEQEQIAYGERLKDFIFGFDDGLITTLAIVSALTGAGVPNLVIIFAGIANILADGLSMSLGGYISSKSQKEVYEKAIEKQMEEIETKPKVKKEDIRNIYRKKGFKGKVLEKIVRTIASDKKIFLETLMKEKLGFSREVIAEPKKVGTTIFISFILAGLIPIAPYFLLRSDVALTIALILSFLSLFVLGAAKTVYTGKNWLKSGLELFVVGFIAASASYFIGSLAHYPKKIF